MPLTPRMNGPDLGPTVKVQKAVDQPSKTYAVDFQQKRVRGTVDRSEAMQQAIYKILATERFAYLIYPWRYGVELNKLLGQNRSVVESRLRGIIEAALLADSRITAIEQFQSRWLDKRSLGLEFTAQTVFGPIWIDKEVQLLGL